MPSVYFVSDMCFDPSGPELLKFSLIELSELDSHSGKHANKYVVMNFNNGLEWKK